MLVLPTESKKLFAHWRGSYKVFRKIGKVNYQVKLMEAQEDFPGEPTQMSEFVGPVQKP